MRAIHYIYFLISQPLVDQKLYLILPVHILGFTYGIIQWIWVEIILNYIGAYAVLELANDMKLYVFATKYKTNTYYEHLIHSKRCVLI